jgi:hypothetical protein
MSDPAVAHALAYPFGIPSGSYLLAGGQAVALNGAGPAVDGREAVLAFGANASPAALAAKLGDRAAAASVPVVAGDLHGFDVVHSAHVSPYGSIPGTLQHSPDAVAAVHVVHLLVEELAAVHRSEPNYVFARLRDIDLRLEGGARLDSVYAYVSRHGCLRLEGAHVGVAAIPVLGRTWPALDQPAMLAAARDLLAPDDDLDDFVLAQATDPEVATARTSELKRDALPFAWSHWEEAGEGSDPLSGGDSRGLTPF